MNYKHTFTKRISAALLALTAAASVCSVSSSAFSVKEDNILHRTSRPLSDGLLYSRILAEENGNTQEGYLFTYRGGLSTVPIVTYGEYIHGRESVYSMAEDLSAAAEEAETVPNVVGGTNGDFFSMATGIPMGILINDGILYSSDAKENAIGIKEDGSVVVGQPGVSVTLHKETATQSGSLEDTVIGHAQTAQDRVAVNHINKLPAVWGAYLLTPAYGETTKSREAGREIVFRVDDGAFTVSEPVTPTETDTAPVPPVPSVWATVTEIRDGATDGEIPADGFVIVLHQNAANTADFADLRVGDTVSLTLTANEGWEDVTFAVGGGDILISDSVAITEGFAAEHAKTRNPRTAIGYTADGTVHVFTVDGRTSASRGMTLAELAETMLSFGCIGALNLDGGGSATVVAKNADGTLSVQNKPTDGNARGVGNAILFLNTAQPDPAAQAIPYAAAITPDAPIVFRDSPVTLSVRFYDQSYTEIPVSDARITWFSDEGIIDETGRLTQHIPQAGVVNVTAEIRIPLSVPAQNGSDGILTEKILTATARVYKTDTLDGITCDTRMRSVPIGGVSAPITVGGIWHGRDVLIDTAYVDAAFVTQTDGESDVPEAPDNPCRNAWGYIDDTLTVHNTVTQTEAEAVSAAAGFPVSRLALTVADSSSTHLLTLPVTFGAEPETVFDMEQPVITEMFCIPGDGTGRLTRLTDGGCGGTAGLAVTAAAIAPVHTPASDNPVKQLRLYLQGDLPENAYLTVTHNGISHTLPWQIADDFTRLNGWMQLKADLTEIDENGLRDFRIDVLLGAASEYSVTLDDVVYHYGDEAAAFTDISGSWAKNDILTVARMGAVSGIPQPDGTYRFDPAGGLTRAAFAKMICVFAGLTPATETEAIPPLSFADADDIPAWALPYIQAVTEAGYMRGKTVPGTADENGNPVTVFAADDTMTRAEVLQVLGTLIRAHYGEPFGNNITVFADDAEIPGWARENIGGCINAGIVTGFSDNTVRPLAEITRAEIAVLLVRLHGILG